jgi:hypothetical protein
MNRPGPELLEQLGEVIREPRHADALGSLVFAEGDGKPYRSVGECRVSGMS